MPLWLVLLEVGFGGRWWNLCGCWPTSPGGTTWHENAFKCSWVLRLLVDVNYKGNLRAIVLAGRTPRANGKMKPNNRNSLQTICTFRGDSLVNDPRLKLQNAGRTHAFKLTTDGIFCRTGGHVEISSWSRLRIGKNGVSLLLYGGDGPATFPTLTQAVCPSALPFFCVWWFFPLPEFCFNLFFSMLNRWWINK